MRDKDHDHFALRNVADDRSATTPTARQNVHPIDAEAWTKQMEKTYEALVQEVGKAKADQFSPRARGKKADAGEGDVVVVVSGQQEGRGQLPLAFGKAVGLLYPLLTRAKASR